MKDLLLQVLGESDTQIDGDPGSDILKNCNTKKEIEDLVELYKDAVKFPILEQFYKDYKNSEPPILGIILTDQSEWIKQSRGNTGDAWKQIGSTDGIWWQDSITAWCHEKNIECYPLPFKIQPGKHKGVADWEEMAQTLGNNFLSNHITFKDRDILFKPSEEATPIKIRQIIIQHSSGTPALSSALYLWGIEQKIAGIENIKFVYIAKDDKNPPLLHTGEHWQWKFKNAQVQELLKISDFNGALAILDSNHKNYQQLKEGLEFLDRSVSFNLTQHDQFAKSKPDGVEPKKVIVDSKKGGEEEKFIVDPKTAIVERVAIAVWSEKAFRHRGHWMHWIIRVAGAFELTLLWLLYSQSNEQYYWVEKTIEDKQKLMYNFDYTVDEVHKLEISRIPISDIVSQLLMNGELKYKYKRPSKKKQDQEKEELEINLQVNAVQDREEWENFSKNFYTNNWELDENNKDLGFLAVRNQLYHLLMGDKVDKSLDKYNIDDEKHPAQVALNHLAYVIKLAGLEQEVKNKVNTYQEKVKKIEGWLV
ncbi:hypothetical protein [Laspinema olomoucense]|uniref:hypothetical protein n=1 Tax=Laspinema olomoucense TaxID=3231600 RepID=UPI0021BAD834|nr:hypothetical protein [Laspinema sp. D3c]MCT7992437.1 hypothetical protein [Laspinema sp. D3c]